jgi:hypothetical protein
MLSEAAPLGDVDIAIELLPKVAEAEFRIWCDIADLPRESREELHIQFDWIFGPGSRFLRGFGGGRVLSACTEFHDLAEMVDVRYRILRGDPERVAALIPAGQSC